MTDEEKRDSGLSLRSYVETRFDLLKVAFADRFSMQECALRESISNLKESLAATDLRYQQRFEAQSDALAAAFQSQQTAMKVALDAAKDAVNAALAAQDRAVTKTELAADKRFEAVTSLITQRFDNMAEKIEESARRVDGIENRVNLISGENIGGEKKKEDQRGLAAILIAIGAVLLALWQSINK